MHSRSQKVIALIAVAAFVGGVCLLTMRDDPVEQVVSRAAPPPTSQATLLKLKQLGARWKRNANGQVNWLYLKYLPLSDDDLVILQELPEVRSVHLRAVQRAKGNQFTNAGLHHLLYLKKLETLDLSANYHLTGECLETLKQLKGLKCLNLEGTSFQVSDLPELCQLKDLKILHVPDFPLDETTIGYFEQMPLRELWGISNRDSDGSIQLLPRLTHLEKLLFEGHKWIKDTDLVHLRHLKKIKNLDVVLTKGFGDTSQLKHLQNSELASLSLSLQQTGAGPADRSGFDALAKVPSLQKIDAEPIDDQCLEAISHCTQLTEFDLTGLGKQITPEGLECLKKMTRLKTISLTKPLVRDKTFEVLGQIPSLEQISMRGWEWTSRDNTPPPISKPVFDMNSLKHLQRLPHLKELRLDYLDLTDDALKHIGQYKTLKRLSLINANITNTGLLHLHSLSQLKNLELTGTKVDLEAVYRLHQSIPECVIEDIWFASGGKRPVFLTDQQEWKMFQRQLHYELD
ncbi:MAG: hypothetical protein KDA77_00185 [Planctomycetaceae bacterium]|nr:hypothetical protein [Planctomycetaceae bacterium]